MEKQQDVLLELLTEHKAEVEEKLQLRSRKFGSKPIERQFQINAGFRDLAGKILAALHTGEAHRALELAQLLDKQLEEHEQDLIIADSSTHGWLAVSKVRSSAELPKELRKKLAQVEKELSTRTTKEYGGPKRKFPQLQQQGQDGFGRNRRVSPEEALFIASKQVRKGQCTYCDKQSHFYRECPTFWARVNEARAKASGGAATAPAADE